MEENIVSKRGKVGERMSGENSDLIGVMSVQTFHFG